MCIYGEKSKVSISEDSKILKSGLGRQYKEYGFEWSRGEIDEKSIFM